VFEVAGDNAVCKCLLQFHAAQAMQMFPAWRLGVDLPVDVALARSHLLDEDPLPATAAEVACQHQLGRG
jgi:hypothetical protein